MQHQRVPARGAEHLTGRLVPNQAPYRPPGHVRVQPPVTVDAAGGYILTRALEANERAGAFMQHGADLDLIRPALRKSLNYRSVPNGHSYPLFYDTRLADSGGHSRAPPTQRPRLSQPRWLERAAFLRLQGKEALR